MGVLNLDLLLTPPVPDIKFWVNVMKSNAKSCGL